MTKVKVYLNKISSKEDSDGCNGWKWKYGCDEKKFNSDNPLCRECKKDAMDAMKEAFNNHVEAAVRDLKGDI